jgi:hypothetical protein
MIVIKKIERIMEWTKNPPVNESDTSEWYWYFNPKEKHPEIIEVWPKRDTKRLDGLWWTTKIAVPILPKKQGHKIEDKTVIITEEKPKKRRGRPKGSKNNEKV